MKRQLQKTGVRKFFGQDLIDLQAEPLKALDGFFAQYGACVVTGCEITAGANNRFNVAPGLVAIEATDSETAVEAIKVMPFGGAEGVVLPLYLMAQSTVVERVYGDGRVKPIAYDFHAVASGVQPETPYITLTSGGNNRFVDVLQDEKHSFITTAERSKWNKILEQAKAYTDTQISEVNSDLSSHNNDAIRHITSAERTSWNAKETPSGAQTKATTAKTEAIATSATDASTKSAAALQSAKEYSNAKDTTLRTDMAVADTATLRTAKDYADRIVAALVDNSPEALNTLQELAKALGNDPNFATTVMQAIGERMKTTDVNTALAEKANKNGNLSEVFNAQSLNLSSDGLAIIGYSKNLSGALSTGDLALFSNSATGRIVLWSKLAPSVLDINNKFQTIYHTGNLDPSTKLDKSGGVVTGATSFNTNGFAAGANEWKMGLESSDMSNEGIVVLRDSAKTYISYLRVGRNKLQWHPTGTNTVVYDIYHSGNLAPASTGITPNTLAQRDASGFLEARIFGDNRNFENDVIGAVGYKNQTNGYHRFCTPDHFKAQLGLYHSGNLVPATASANGLMSSADKNKLDSIDGKPKVYGYISANGMFQGTTRGVNRVDTTQGQGVYRVFHGLNHTFYMVQLTSQNEGLPRMNLSASISPTYFEVRICNQSSGNSVLSNNDFSFVVFEY